MKIITAPFLFLIIFFTFLIHPLNNIFASNSKVIDSISLTNGTQSLYSNIVPLDLYINSRADLNNVQIKWTIPSGVNLTFNESQTYNINLLSTSTYFDSINIEPKYKGIYNIGVDVIGTYNGEIFDESSTINLNIDDNLKLQNSAALDSYNFKNNIYFLLSGIFLLVVVFILKDVYKYSRIIFHNWLNKD